MNDIPPGMHDKWLEPPEDRPHHPDCPQHPWNNVLDKMEPCECRELLQAERDDAKEGALD